MDLRLHILPRWNAAEAVTSLAWEEAREELHEGMSWSSVRRVGKHLRILLRFAAAKGAIRSVPEIRSPPRELIAAEAKELEPFTRKERDRLLADLRRRGNLRALRCYEVMFFNLFRKSTVERLMPSWLDLQKHTVKVPASKAKNSKTRVYWLHPRAEKAIKAQIKENEHAVHLNGSEGERTWTSSSSCCSRWRPDGYAAGRGTTCAAAHRRSSHLREVRSFQRLLVGLQTPGARQDERKGRGGPPGPHSPPRRPAHGCDASGGRWSVYQGPHGGRRVGIDRGGGAL